MNKKQTSPSVASKAAKILSNKNSTAAERSVAASDLSQTRNKRKK